MIRRFSLLTGTVLTLSLFAAPAAVMGAPGDLPAAAQRFAGRNVIVRAEQQRFAAPLSMASRNEANLVAGTPTSDIRVTYSASFTAKAKAVFEAAVSVWEHTLVSSRPIHVNAKWKSLPNGVLGSAGANGFYLGDDDYVYPAALMEALCGCATEPTFSYEIVANFNSSFPSWYMGTDGNVPNDKWDFFSVVLHELGHGLGFMSSFGVGGGVGGWGFTNDGVTFYPLRYDSFEMTAETGGNSLINDFANGSAPLKTELTDGSVYFAGPNAVATAGERVELYAPSPWDSGSSNSHVDQDRYDGTAESLMTPALVNGQSDGAPGPVTIAMMQDIGWTVNTSGGGGPTPPANDNFANASAANLTSSKTATTTDATLETDEPQPACATGTDKTVWYSYTPGTTRTVIATTSGSNFDTVLAIYTGSSLATLVPVACNDDRAVDSLSKLKLTLTGGVTYYFQVGGASGDSGALTFRLKKP